MPLPVLGYIAKTVTHNGRDLEGALNRLLAHNKLTGHAVTLEMAEREVRDLIRPQEPKRVKIEDIQRVVARQYNVSRSDLLSSRRTANVVRPRQVAMYLAKTLTLRSLPEIGRRFGGRDHTTVLHAVRKIEGLVGNDMALAEEIEIAEAAVAGVICLPRCGAMASTRSAPRTVPSAPRSPARAASLKATCGPWDKRRAKARPCVNPHFRHLCSPAPHSATPAWRRA